MYTLVDETINNLVTSMKTTEMHLQQAEVYKANGHWEKALSCYRQVAESQPENWQGFNGMGDALLNLERWEEAVVAYRRSLELNPNFDWTYHNLAVALNRLERIEEADFYYEKLLDLNPQFREANQGDWRVQQQFGDFLFRQERWEEASQAYRSAIALNSDFIWNYLNLGRALSQLKQWNEAIDCFNHAIEMNPSLAKVHYHFSETLAKLERWDDALRFYQQAIELKPDLLLECQKFGDELQRNVASNRIADEATDVSELLLEELEVDDSFSDEMNLSKPDVEKQEDWQQQHDLFALISSATQDPKMVSLPEFQQLCRQERDQLSSPKLNLEYGCWLSPSILYIEGSVQDCWVLGETKVLLLSNDACEVGQANFFQISHQQFVSVAVFDKAVYTKPFEVYNVTTFSGKTPVLVEGSISEKAYSLELINRLNSKPEYQKHLIREKLSQAVIQFIPLDLQHEVSGLFYKLQHFLQIAPTSFVDLKQPFKISIDHIIPVRSEGVFLSGWIHDPYSVLEEIEAISALGFSIPISINKIYRITRADVVEYLKNSPYGNFEGKHGFCTYAEVSDETREKIEGFAELHSFRFKVKLKGGIDIEVVPETRHYDAFTARKLVMQIAPIEETTDEMLENCIAPAAMKLQQLCMQQVSVKEVVAIGKPVVNPVVSIIIPLYKQLDFMKVQVATLANDPFVKKQCEIVYVLDSPEQEREVRDFLLDHCLLYELPVKLIIMARNSGYAAANNTGASHASGEYLILLNSDVFHKTQGWVAKMVEFYAASPEIGTLAPKLIYEDDSIQHAGMYFERTRFPFWLTLHYYKGFPNRYELAQVSRAVPAVTGACLMIRNDLYKQVGGMSTEYIIGDFEDSDLCFKCASLGYESWYFADVELYHLERQSMPLSTVYSGSLAWQCNARLHERRWNKLIEKLMHSN